jgi:anaerobic magnesium-protoporphyrin IX monomethyl ester cyclase
MNSDHKNIKKIIFVRCPKYMWPWVNESDNFLFPIGLPIVAAAIREKIKDVSIKIIDCPPSKIGWESLEKMLREEKPDIIGAGEEALYHHETIRLFKLAKKIDPAVITLAGGHYFSWMVEDSLKNYPIDIIVRFEGEETTPELIAALLDNGDLSKVKGIAYKRNGEVVVTPLRPLMENLDLLPIPAYDLMPMRKYAPKGIFWPESATIEGSRGCVDTCSYCALWTFWGRHKKTAIERGELEVTPCYRRKSVPRIMQEIEILYEKYDRHLLLWADPTFNVEPRWTEALCDEILKRNYKMEHWVFLRADFTLRDERLGVLEKMVAAGFVHPLFGIERSCIDEWEKLNKHGYKRDEIKEIFHLLRDKYPQVFRQATFVTCLPFDNAQSMREMARYAVEIDCDFPVFHPITPTPGTYLYKEMIDKDYLEEKDLKEAYWEYPLLKNVHGISREKMAVINRNLHLYCLLHNLKTIIRGLISKYPTKRYRYREVMRVFIFKFLQSFSIKIKSIFSSEKKKEGKIPKSLFFELKKPSWYDK